MSRSVICILGLGLLVGCASTKPEAEPVVLVIYEDQPAAALAYAAPVRDLSAPIDFVADREYRRPRAFIGYESLVREYFWLRTEDNQRFGGGYGHGGGHYDRYERRAISTRVGVIER